MKKPTPQLCGFNWLGAVFSGVVFLKILLKCSLLIDITACFLVWCVFEVYDIRAFMYS